MPPRMRARPWASSPRKRHIVLEGPLARTLEVHGARARARYRRRRALRETARSPRQRKNPANSKANGVSAESSLNTSPINFAIYKQNS